jgi:hypothetical protein
MRASTPLLLTFLTVGGGRIAENNDPVFTSRIVVGGTIVILGVAMTNAFSPQLATAFALLILVVAFLRYGISLMRSIGFQVGGGR